MEKKIKVADLVSRFRQDFDYYKSERYNETLLRSDFLDPLFELLGWDIKNVQYDVIAGESSANDVLSIVSESIAEYGKENKSC